MLYRSKAALLVFPVLLLLALLVAGQAPADNIVRSQGKHVTVSSATPGYGGECVTDGDLTNRWQASDGTYPQLVTVDIGTVQPLGSVRIVFFEAHNRVYTYRLYGSNDLHSFHDLIGGRRSAAGTVTHNVTGAYRYVRLRIDACKVAGKWASVRELQVFGTFGAVSTPKPTPTATPTRTATPAPTATGTSAPTPRPTQTATPKPVPTVGTGPLPPTPGQYGCSKPVTTLTLKNHRVVGGMHDITYSHMRFEGVGTSSSGGGVLGIVANSGNDGDIYNITFEDCVIATIPPGNNGNGVHCWNLSTTGSVIYNITFRRCWFEPQPRMAFEWNGRGGWWHDVTIENCTFEAGGGQMLSFDMSPVSGDPVPPYGINVNGVVRGSEGLHIRNNDFRGTGVSVNGFSPQYTMGLEFGCVYPYARDKTIGRSEFVGNRVGRTASAWMQCNRNGASYMTFSDNLFDWTYNPGRIGAGPEYGVYSGTAYNNCTFRDNTYVLNNGDDRPSGLFVSTVSGSNNTFVGEHWTKAGGSMAASVTMPFTTSTYVDCQFHLPSRLVFPASASGTGCTFDGGRSGGVFQ